MTDINVENQVEKYKKENISVAKHNGKEKYNGVTITQLRLLLSNSVIIKNKIQCEGKDKNEISERLQNEIKYLLVKHIYQCGRDKKLKDFNGKFEISERIKNIGKSAEEFHKFYRYLEEIIAYMKYYGLDETTKN